MDSATMDLTAARLRRSCVWMRGSESRSWNSFDLVDILDLDVAAWLASGWVERMTLPGDDVEAIALTAAAFDGVAAEAAGEGVLCLGLGAENGHLTFAARGAACAALRLPTDPIGPEREPTVALLGAVLPRGAFVEPGRESGWERRTLTAIGGAMASLVRPQTLLIDVDTAAFEAEATLGMMERALPLWRGPIAELTDALARAGEAA